MAGGTPDAHFSVMSEATAAAADVAAAPAAPRGGSSKKLVLLLVALNVLALGAGGGYVFWTTQKAEAAAAAAATSAARGGAAAGDGEGGEGEAQAPGATRDADDDKPDEEDPIFRGQVIALDPIITNIGSTDEGRFVKVTVQLEVRTEEAKGRVEAASVPIRDAIIAHLSSLTPGETEGDVKKREIKERLRQLVNAEVQGNPVRRVYFTEFLVQ